MTCNEITPQPFPACATTLIVGTTTPTASDHRAQLRNLATDRIEQHVATIDGLGVVTVTLNACLQAGHEYALELWDYNTSPVDQHLITLCGHTAAVVRLRPVLIYDTDGDPVGGTWTLTCQP
jgi:hypothetical protein